jgi:hypothetical protein
MNFGTALNAASIAANNPQSPESALPLHSYVRVRYCNDCYGGSEGVVVGYSKNLLGVPLVHVQLSNVQREQFFYIHELERP